MTPTYSITLRAALVAAAMAGLGMAQAQPAPTMPAPHGHAATAAPAHQTPAQRRGGPNGEPLNADRLATREGQPQDFERNAVARCEAFTSMEERRLCVERTRQPTAGGSVSGGGVLRVYTETVRP